MPIKHYKPTTPGRRHASVIVNSEVTTARPQKSLLTIKKNHAGRSHGKISVRHRGGEEKRYLRLIDFKRDKWDMPAKVLTLEYDPNRTSYIALLEYSDGEKRYMLALEELHVDMTVASSQQKTEQKLGYAMPLEFILPGTEINCIELLPGRGASLARSAGASATMMGCEGKHAQVKMPSGEIRLIPKECLATIGKIGKSEHKLMRIGKAGRARHMGLRPEVRGSAMNPVDHPHGGGEGNQSIGMKYPKTPWGKHASGVRTRKAKKRSSKLILKRRPSRKKKK